MVNDAFILSWYLGIGGPRPGVMLVSTDADQGKCILDLQQGQSVYAADLDSRNGLLAAGTRTGQIAVLGLPQEEGQAAQRLLSLEQGAPVLSVCFIGGSRLASTDTAGRCLLWRPFDAPHDPYALEAEGSMVCSLLEVQGDRLLGLSATGRLLLWNLADGRLLKSVRSPAPPGKLAMVQLVRWPRTNTVAYPAADGRLVLCELEAMQLHTLEAHNESFYAVFVVGQDLCTVGTSDGILKAWQRIAPAPAWQCNAPTGIIGGQEAGPDTGQILLITYDGQTAIHVLRSGKLHLHRALAENHARVVCSANWQARLKILQKRRTAKVQELCTQIKECVAAGQSGEIDTLHRQLIAMGSQTLSLALQAWRAAKEKDTVGELRARYSLAQRLPTDAPLAAKSLRRYGHVLHESWLLRDALTVYAHIGGPEKDHVLPGWLEQTAEMMEGDDWVAHAKPPIPDLVGAATILNRPFTGRWVLNVLGTIQFPEGLLTAEGLVRKYEQVRNEEGRSGLPVAEARLFHWLSRRMPRTIATVLFIGAADPATEGAELAVQVLQDGLQTILVEHLLFHAVGTLKQGQSAMDYNNRTTEVLARIGRPERAGPWLRAVRRALSRAIQRLHTEAVYRRREGRD